MFSNQDLVQQVMDTMVRQLYLTQVINAVDFDNAVASDGYYITNIRNNFQRVLVLRNLSDQTNRNLADIVVFCKAGLVSVLANKVGPVGITLPIDKAYYSQLVHLNVPPPSERPDVDDEFVGEDDNDNFDPNVLDPNFSPEPVNE